MEIGLLSYEVVDSRGDRHLIDADRFEVEGNGGHHTVSFYQADSGVLLINTSVNRVGFFINPTSVNRLKDRSVTSKEATP